MRSDASKRTVADQDGSEPASPPVHRFWSGLFASHFYTIDEAEKDHLVSLNPVRLDL